MGMNPGMAGMGGMGAGPGGMADITRMQEQLMRNPEMMREIMASPMMQNMMSNPELIRNMILQNPQMRQVLDANPQLNHVLQDPALMRQTMELMQNPEALRQLQRSQDLAMSQIENHPEGFNALRRMYQDVQVSHQPGPGPSVSQS
jgi:ubiquilin